MTDARAVVESWFEAMEARDLERITELMTEDVTMETEASATPITGRQVIHDLLAGAMDASESIRIERKKVVGSGPNVAALVRMRVRFGSDLEMLGEKLSTAGKQLDILSALFVEVNDAGRIARVARVRDTLGLIEQLGLSPERVRELARKFEARAKTGKRAA